jgi:REP element-mobilizing transposase RayT
MQPDFVFPDRGATFQIRRGNLPHWTLERVLYFVTFRLADSVPAAASARRRPDSSSIIDRRAPRFDVLAFERWFDHGLGSCVLANPTCRAIVEDAIRYFANERYYLDEFVVAPNHVHVLVAPWAPWSLSGILQSWKSFTSRRIRDHLRDRVPSLRERVWQRESFDHVVRTPLALDEYRTYIRAHRRTSAGMHGPKPPDESQDSLPSS